MTPEDMHAEIQMAKKRDTEGRLFFSYHTDNPNSKLLPSTPSGVGSRRLPRSRTRPIASGQVDLQHRHEQPSEACELCVAESGLAHLDACPVFDTCPGRQGHGQRR